MPFPERKDERGERVVLACIAGACRSSTVARNSGRRQVQPLTKNVQVTHASEYCRKPFQFLLEMFAPLSIDEVGNRPQLAAQAAGRCAQAMDSLRLTPACLGIGGLQPDNGPLERRADQLGRGIFRFDRRHCHGCGPERLRPCSSILVTIRWRKSRRISLGVFRPALDLDVHS